MGPCGGKQKKMDPKQEEQILKQQKIANLQEQINALHIKVFQLTTQIAQHELKKETDKQKTKEWGIDINKVDRDQLKIQIQSLKEQQQNEKFFNSLPLQQQEKFKEQRALNTLR